MRTTMILLLLSATHLFGDIAVTVDARKDLQLTVYRDFAVVKDIRKANIPEGGNRIRFEGVATEIRPETVNLNWRAGTGIELIAQSYEYDLVSPEKLMEKFVGREVEIIPHGDQWPDTARQMAELISINGTEPVFRIGTKITFGNMGRILFPYIPDNLYVRPTLLWNVFVQKRQQAEIAATYITEGFSWKADYMLHIEKNDNAGMFGGWITYRNESGLDCRNAQVTFVAGDVRRIREADLKTIIAPAAPRDYGDYSFYAMNQRVTILSNRSNQVEWIPRVPIKVKPHFFVELVSEVPGGMQSPVVYSAVEVENSSANNIGIPLPEGIVRVFKQDANDELRFIGENIVNATKVGQTFHAVIGHADEITVVQKVLPDGESCQIEVKNNRPKSAAIRIRVDTGGRGVVDASRNHRIVQNTSLEWNIVVKSSELQKLSYRLEKKGR